MPGSADANLRSARLAENLGVLLLQSVGSVAPVDRADDVGFDAICTVLEADPHLKRPLTARETFCVQFKTASTRSLQFTSDQLRWLLELDTPYFIGRVSLTDASLALYSLSGLLEQHHWTPLKDCRALTLDLASPPHPDERSPDAAYLGPPILQWSVRELADLDELRRRLVPPTRDWCQIATRNIRLRSYDSAEFYRWDTNSRPERAGSFTSSAGADSASLDLFPPVWALLLSAFGQRDNTEFSVWHSVVVELHRRGAVDGAGS